MTIFPVSELRNYNRVLNAVRYGEPVILTKNGRPQYAVVDIDEWQKQQAKLRLLEELQKGYQSIHTEGGVSADDFLKELQNDFECLYCRSVNAGQKRC